MSQHRVMAMVAAVLFTATCLALTVDRGGIIAWAGQVVGVALLLKVWIRPDDRDVALSLAVAAGWALIWAGTTYYVLSTWESGEVVTLGVETPDGTHTARVWALDAEDALVLLYDAPPEIAEALLQGGPVTLERGGQLSVEHPVARPMDDLPQDEVDAIFALMEQKYAELNRATDVFYGFLGRRRDRVVVIVTLER